MCLFIYFAEQLAPYNHQMALNDMERHLVSDTLLPVFIPGGLVVARLMKLTLLIGTCVLCKATRQYLLTLQVSRYCLVALHDGGVQCSDWSWTTPCLNIRSQSRVVWQKRHWANNSGYLCPQFIGPYRLRLSLTAMRYLTFDSWRPKGFFNLKSSQMS